MWVAPVPSLIEATGSRDDPAYRVRLGPFDDADAASAMTRIAAAGFEPEASPESAPGAGSAKRCHRRCADLIVLSRDAIRKVQKRNARYLRPTPLRRHAASAAVSVHLRCDAQLAGHGAGASHQLRDARQGGCVARCRHRRHLLSE